MLEMKKENEDDEKEERELWHKDAKIISFNNKKPVKLEYIPRDRK
jgi:hypothetical protein